MLVEIPTEDLKREGTENCETIKEPDQSEKDVKKGDTTVSLANDSYVLQARLAQWLNWKHVDALSWVGVPRSALLGQMAQFTRGTDCCASAFRALTVLPRNGRKVLLVPYLSTGDFRESC